MATVQEYVDSMMSVSAAITDGEFKNKREIKHLVALAHQAVVKERNRLQQQIADRWKVRFKEIKDHNDSLQRDVANWYRDEIQRINEEEARLISEVK